MKYFKIAPRAIAIITKGNAIKMQTMPSRFPAKSKMKKMAREIINPHKLNAFMVDLPKMYPSVNGKNTKNDNPYPIYS